MAGDWVPITTRPEEIIARGFTTELPDPDRGVRRFWYVMGALAVALGGCAVVNHLTNLW